MLSAALPERLRLETRDLHAATERTGAMAALLQGRLPRPGYHAMLRNLHAIYAALEAALDARQHDAAITPLQTAALYRAAALAEDLQALHGPGWAQDLPLQPAALAYVARLHALGAGAERDSPALVAHAYVRYLGDLHGGQVLARLVTRHLGLVPAPGWAAGASTGHAVDSSPGSSADSSPNSAIGTRFYDFGPAERLPALRQGLRAALGRLPLDEAAQDQVVAEARWAFVQHQHLFQQLMHAAAAARADGRPDASVG